MNLYKYFISSYIISSAICFCTEMIMPSIRTKEITRTQILENTKQIIPTVGKNIVISFPYFYVFENYLVYDVNTHYKITGITDIFLWWVFFIYYAFIWLLLTDILFYFSHRAFHHPKLYWLHVKHHSFKYTHGIGAIYASIPDFFFTIIIPGTAPIYLFSIPYYYSQLIILLASFYTVLVSHSGFKYFNSHLLHHLKYKVNYGLFFTDKLFLTSSKQTQKLALINQN